MAAMIAVLDSGLPLEQCVVSTTFAVTNTNDYLLDPDFQEEEVSFSIIQNSQGVVTFITGTKAGELVSCLSYGSITPEMFLSLQEHSEKYCNLIRLATGSAVETL